MLGVPARERHPMSRQILLTFENAYTCDVCKNEYLSRVLTDSYTGLDICFDCACTGEHGLFYEVTQSPDQDGGDNLLDVAKSYDCFVED